MTKMDEYKPTNAEKKIIEVMSNPDNATLSVTNICQRAEISREMYYRSFRKPEFVAYHDAFCKDLVKQAVTPVINACIKEAKAGSYQHAKIILEMAGMYVQTQKHEVSLAAKLEDFFGE